MSTTYITETGCADDAPVRCDNCGWEGRFDQVDAITDIGERIEPGEPCPAGQCPEDDCCALVYLIKPEPKAGAALLLRDIAAQDYMTGLGAVEPLINSWIKDARALSAAKPEPNTSDIPEATEEFFAKAKLRNLAALRAVKEYVIWRDNHGGKLSAADVPNQIDQMMDEAFREITEPTRLAIVLEGGLVQAVVSNKPDVFKAVEVLVIDYDDEGVDEDDLTDVPQDDGSVSDAIVHEEGVTLASIDLAAVSANLNDVNSVGEG